MPCDPKPQVLIRRTSPCLQELRLRFLQCREEWLGEMVDELDDGHPYESLKRLTDVYRLHLFAVVMHYRAIFSDASSMQARPLQA